MSLKTTAGAANHDVIDSLPVKGPCWGGSPHQPSEKVYVGSLPEVAFL